MDQVSRVHLRPRSTDCYRQDMDLVAEWLAERCELDHDLENLPKPPNAATLKGLRMYGGGETLQIGDTCVPGRVDDFKRNATS